jgi:hypothetical protein
MASHAAADLGPDLRAAIAAIRDGRKDEALPLLVALYRQACEEGQATGPGTFIVMFTWEQLARDHEPARQALARERDAQAARLLGGDNHVGPPGNILPRSRFADIVRINEVLGEAQATRSLFIQLIALQPAIAHGQAWLALPAVVETGDFALAQAYLRDPLTQLDGLNLDALRFPLWPMEGTPPRLAVELANFVKDVLLNAAVLRGLGREEQAAALHDAAIAGLASDELRALAVREVADPGTIRREIADRRVASAIASGRQ